MARLRVPARSMGLLAFLKAHKRSVVFLAVALLFLYAVVPQFAGFGRSLTVLREANLGWIGVAFVCWCIIYLLAAALYQIVALYPLGFRRTLEAQIASGFTGKLLPSGLGVVGLYIQYLRKCGHSLGEAVAVVSVNNLAAIVGHIGLIIVIIAAGAPLPSIDIERFTPGASSAWVVAAVTFLLAAAGVVFRRKLHGFWLTIVKTFSVYRQHPGKVIWAIVVSVPQTAAYIGVLYASMLALGGELDIRAVFMVATFSMLVGTLIPVPGGIVGAEAGLTAGFVAYGFGVSEGLAIALIYRAFIYWLPIAPGLAVFAYRRRDYM
jgi:glycosyltransferase 2 family protein